MVADDAVVIDTTRLSIEEAVERVMQIVAARIANL
jgi:cytidylate kinase